MDIGALAASMLCVGDIAGSKRHEKISIGQPVTGSILSLSKRFLEQYDDTEYRESTNRRFSPMKLSGRDGKILEEIFWSQHERARQRVATLLHGRIDPPKDLNGGLVIRSTSDSSWQPLTGALNDTKGNMNEQEHYSWNRVNESAHRGIRRLAKNLPEPSGT